MSGSPIRHGVPANQRGAVADNCSLHQPDRLSLGRCPNGGCRLNRTLGAPPAPSVAERAYSGHIRTLGGRPAAECGFRPARSHIPGQMARFTPMTTITSTRLEDRIDALDWTDLRRDLDEQGFAVTEPVLHRTECRELAGLFDGEGFRSTIDMARHRFGDGRYRYFDHPLPAPVQAARTAFYAHLAPIANAWSERLSGDTPRFPDTPRGAARALRRGRAGTPDAAAPALPPRGLERAPSGPLRRGVLPVPGPDRALGSRARLRRRGVRAARAAPPRPEPRARPAPGAGRARGSGRGGAARAARTRRRRSRAPGPRAR